MMLINTLNLPIRNKGVYFKKERILYTPIGKWLKTHPELEFCVGSFVRTTDKQKFEYPKGHLSLLSLSYYEL